MRIINVITILFLTCCSSLVQAKKEKLFLFENLKKESSFRSSSVTTNIVKSRIILISNANLYPTPMKFAPIEDLVNNNPRTLYEESQVLLQESIREITKFNSKNNIDLVIFGGNQVSRPSDYELFKDIAYDLQKHSISYYEIQGPNEKKAESFFKHKYHLLKTNNIYILLLDNVTENIIPTYLPEEATQQYLWLEKTLKDLSNKINPVYIFSYYPLDRRTVNYLNSYPKLNLKLVAYSADSKFSNSQTSKLPGNFIHSSKPIIISNSSTSIYPCAYTIIEDDDSKIQITNKLIALKGIRELARKK